jgi:hypothetical protein
MLSWATTIGFFLSLFSGAYMFANKRILAAYKSKRAFLICTGSGGFSEVTHPPKSSFGDPGTAWIPPTSSSGTLQSKRAGIGCPARSTPLPMNILVSSSVIPCLDKNGNIPFGPKYSF